jgi:hypothetical protein
MTIRANALLHEAHEFRCVNSHKYWEQSMPSGLDDFNRAVQEIRRTYDLDLTPDEDGTATISFDDEVRCTIEVPVDSDFIYFHADVDRPPAVDREELFATLLRLNVFMVSVDGAWIGLDPETDEVLICASLPLLGITAERLNATLTGIANLVLEIREAMREGAYLQDKSDSMDLSMSNDLTNDQDYKLGGPLRG